MPYEYLDDIAIADVAFRAEGSSLEEVFREAVDATMNTMVENLTDIAQKKPRQVSLSSESIDMLLFALLQELIFFKDAEQLLLRVYTLSITRDGDTYRLSCTLSGEKIDPIRHNLIVDVKAVTLYKFSVEQSHHGYRATVVLDV
jgi:SHS2 domain-containing protein